jgi:hypothetical protein
MTGFTRRGREKERERERKNDGRAGPEARNYLLPESVRWFYARMAISIDGVAMLVPLAFTIARSSGRNGRARPGLQE